MNDTNYLSMIREGYPARLDSSHTAKLLGFGDHDVPVLVSTGLLKPLGTPMPNAPKYFALVEILSHAADRDWLNRATKTLSKHWQKKNDEQRSKRAGTNRLEANDPRLNGPKQLSAELSATGPKK